ncbi:branched-chain amino acid ABC transporter permease [Ferruginivarius sediminum]|uniref:Branched-chain amino acid ABC transporter permease n=1 Tax=Ferruginivarius sediminum TaxID=2661937 RepID=A0A369T4L2_9PROT|nr:branched-chain amino acid ABC transporter permease [Ferruginivarius sediminum]RDD60178.1 branched-chain amino acid ABC transporter permease [Ferruginivarius sediminum]
MTVLDSVLQILVSGITLGGMYAVSAIGLALLWGVMGMLNMAHGSLIAIGAYASVFAVGYLGGTWYLGLPAAMIVGCLAGVLLYFATARWMVGSGQFEMNIIIATVGVAIVVKSLLIIGFTGYPQRQPFALEGGIYLGNVLVPYQTMLIVCVAIILMMALSWLLKATRMGRAIRATAQSQKAAALMGIPAERIYLQVMVIAGVLAAISGVLISSTANTSPSLGEVTMLKVFIICVVAGLGNIPGTILISFALAVLEAAIQYALSAKWAFPLLLGIAVMILIWRPYGLFGAARIRKV